MKAFGAFLMRSRQNAMLSAFAFAFLPILHWLSAIIIALVTLRRGAKEGALILLSVLAPLALLALFWKNSMAAYNATLAVTSVWLLAIILHDTHNWSVVLLVGAGLAILGIIVVHGYITDINAWWQHRMLNYLQQMGADIPINMLRQKQTITYLSKIATGMQAAVLLWLNLIWLLLARYWQAILYNPGAFRAELHNISMPRWASLFSLVLLAMTLLLPVPLLIDLLPAAFLPFTFAAASLIHFILAARQANGLWLVIFYVLLIFALPYVCVVLIILAWADSLINLRRYYQASS